MSQNPSHAIPLHTLLGERYKVTASALETADGDAVLEGKDQVLNRKVSIVVATPEHNDRLMTNARTLARNSRSTVQILDLGNTNGRTYLITSYSRSETLVENLLTDSQVLAASSETQEALGQEIFGDEAHTGQNSHVSRSTRSDRSSISATRDVEPEASAAAGSTAAAPAATGVAAGAAGVGAGAAAAAGAAAHDGDPTETLAAGQGENEGYEYTEYDEYPEEPDFDDEDDRSRGGVLVVAIAAILLLVMGVAAVFANLNGMVDQDASNEAADVSDAYSTTPSPTAASSSASASPSPTPTQKPNAEITTASRVVPSNPNLMADQDRTLGQMTDGNPATQWMSYGFGSANFGGLVSDFSLAFELKDKTTVSQLTMDQVGGSGGAFTVYTNDSASLDGATEVGTGSFSGPQVQTSLDTKKQGEGAKYVIVKFTEAPQQSQPIAGMPYGLRIAEVKASN